MKYQFELKGKPEDVFDYNFYDVDSKYFETKNKHIKDLSNKKITFQIEKPSNKKKIDNVSYATIKVMKYDFPKSFAFDYKSNTYQKYTEYELVDYDQEKDTTTFTVYFYDSIKKNGVTKARNSDSKDLKKAPLTLKLQFRRSFKDYMNKKRLIEDE